jgi:hypothetical protein
MAAVAPAGDEGPDLDVELSDRGEAAAADRPHHARIDRRWRLWQQTNPGEHPALSGSAATMDPWTETDVGNRDITAQGVACDSAWYCGVVEASGDGDKAAVPRAVG